VNPAHEEHLATRRRAGLFDFSFMGLYEFAEAAALQPLQTRDLARLAPGRMAYTLLMDDDGRVVNDATVWNLADGRWWLFSGRRGDAGWIAARASARVRTGEHAIVALQGPCSGAILARVVGEAVVRSLRYFDFAAFEAASCAGRPVTRGSSRRWMRAADTSAAWASAAVTWSQCAARSIPWKPAVPVNRPSRNAGESVREPLPPGSRVTTTVRRREPKRARRDVDNGDTEGHFSGLAPAGL